MHRREPSENDKSIFKYVSVFNTLGYEYKVNKVPLMRVLVCHQMIPRILDGSCGIHNNHFLV